jgi:hypothetical protein
MMKEFHTYVLLDTGVPVIVHKPAPTQSNSKNAILPMALVPFAETQRRQLQPIATLPVELISYPVMFQVTQFYAQLEKPVLIAQLLVEPILPPVT